MLKSYRNKYGSIVCTTVNKFKMFLTCWQKKFLLAVSLDDLSKTVFKDELLEIGMKSIQNLEAAFAVVLQNRCF